MRRELRISLREHYDELLTERDRRYAEVNAEREKALKIKEDADKTALGLAREIQVYKDEKANELRSQIESERGSYLTRQEYEDKQTALVALISRNSDEIVAARGERKGVSDSRTTLIAVLIVLVGIAAAISPHL